MTALTSGTTTKKQEYPSADAMTQLKVTQPMDGTRLVTWGDKSILFGQPPEVLKSLLKSGIRNLDTLVLPDARERGGTLLNNLEFLLYYFLFIINGLKDNRKLNLVGDPAGIAQTMRHLHLTLLGPSTDELQGSGMDPKMCEELVNASEFFALKGEDGAPRPVESFFNAVPFVDDYAHLEGCSIKRLSPDRFRIQTHGERLEVDLTDTHQVNPPYVVQSDYTPNELVNFGVTVLGGASGFSPEQASTGLALCFDGHYIVIDSIPYLEHHIRARGISTSQVHALFLTHLHDDHCNMFPLMLMPHQVEVITTREIFNMAMEKLSMGLGWNTDAVRSHFKLVEIVPGETLNYYGLHIDAHYTVHSIPTIGATFWTSHHGHKYEICVVGDNQSFDEIDMMRSKSLLREETVNRLHELYKAPFDILIADGGMGQIHGDPADALESQADRVLYVHVDQLPERFNSTFSLATAGKRYTVVDGNSDIYTTRAIEYLNANFPKRLSTRWLNTLFADKRITRYNKDDVILKQGAETRGIVILILTGTCDVIHHDGERYNRIATREAGDLIGEMAGISGTLRRNSSVVASTPVILCEFSEETFLSFIEEEGLKPFMLRVWALRTALAGLPQFQELGSSVIDKMARAGEKIELATGEELDLTANGGYWGLLIEGRVADRDSGAIFDEPGQEFGPIRPFAPPAAGLINADSDCIVVRFQADTTGQLIREIPRLNYLLRKHRLATDDVNENWRI